ncbi:DNA-binding response regulator, NarL/FixJ family [Terrimicrobium sacchariphilum]|uniref:DNA-binding response regulator, NarL/FixJ family n=1 Tax=Terrimicrobium sacchariphilum TaxID=690879 RepID=A0A146GAE2_TERSA|nr:response regulator transcription factor [Terrimicrobium sacchariphilum]GAT34420.1 DNA-binding response regulator, NarL/FixJ family [Terrimicrobium sacchariphilum]
MSTSLDLPRILMIDDEPDLPQIVENLLVDICTVEGYPTGELGIEAAARKIFPVAIVDLQIKSPQGSQVLQGIEIMESIRRSSPFTQIIILTANASMESAISAVNQGAFQYLVKPFLRAPLRKTISEALKAYEAALLADERLSLTNGHFQSFGLTPRLADIAEGILDGQTNEEIAKRLKIADRTVEKHVERLLAHFGIHSRFLLESKLIKMLRQLRKSDSWSFTRGEYQRSEPDGDV